MKDAALGIAGLDADARLTVDLSPILSEYSSHTGDADAVMYLNSGGGGSSANDAVNHEADISSGLSAYGSGRFETHLSKNYYLSATPKYVTVLINNIVQAVGADAKIYVGMKNAFSSNTDRHCCIFKYEDNGIWYAVTAHGTNDEQTTPITIANEDFLTIKATNTKVEYFVNYTKVAEHTLYITTGSLNLGAGCLVGSSAVTTAASCSIDMIKLVNI